MKGRPRRDGEAAELDDDPVVEPASMKGRPRRDGERHDVLVHRRGPGASMKGRPRRDGEHAYDTQGTKTQRPR